MTDRVSASDPLPFQVDVAVVGAGPAGLTAAIYHARFHLSIRLFDCGSSRAALIPRTHNHAGYPEGIEGIEPESGLRRKAPAASAGPAAQKPPR